VKFLSRLEISVIRSMYSHNESQTEAVELLYTGCSAHVRNFQFIGNRSRRL